jgi:uncharacterized membrane protein YidH (DUF202 family)
MNAAVRSQAPIDKGLARERTALAWNRSGLAVVVCIGVLVRNLWPIRGAGRDVAVCLIAAAAIVWSIALFAFTHSGTDRDEGALLGSRVLQLMTAGTVLLAIVGFLLTFFASP